MSVRSRDLVSGELVLAAPGGRGLGALLWVFVLLLVGGIAAGAFWIETQGKTEARLSVMMAELSELDAKNRALSQALRESDSAIERLLLDLEIAAVAQLELERQMVVLKEQLKQTREELDYVKSAGN